MAQWLRLHAFNAGDGFSILDWGTKIPHASQCGQKIKKQKVHIKLSKYRPLAFEQEFPENRRAQGGGVRWVELAL